MRRISQLKRAQLHKRIRAYKYNRAASLNLNCCTDQRIFISVTANQRIRSRGSITTAAAAARRGMARRATTRCAAGWAPAGSSTSSSAQARRRLRGRTRVRRSARAPAAPAPGSPSPWAARAPRAWRPCRSSLLCRLGGAAAACRAPARHQFHSARPDGVAPSAGHPGLGVPGRGPAALGTGLTGRGSPLHTTLTFGWWRRRSPPAAGAGAAPEGPEPIIIAAVAEKARCIGLPGSCRAALVPLLFFPPRPPPETAKPGPTLRAGRPDRWLAANLASFDPPAPERQRCSWPCHRSGSDRSDND